MTGHAAEAFDRIAASLPTAESSDLREWGLSTLAEIAGRLGRDDEAARLYQQALALDPEDAYSLSAYADLLLDQGRPKEVAAMLAARTDNDNLLLRLVLAQTALGDSGSREADLLAARYDASRLRGDTVHRREEARFVLGVRHDARAALALARANWEVQREPWDVRVVLEAAVAAKDAGSAAPVLAFLDEHHLEDPRVRALERRLKAPW